MKQQQGCFRFYKVMQLKSSLPFISSMESTEWPRGWKKSIYVPKPKKGSIKKAQVIEQLNLAQVPDTRIVQFQFSKPWNKSRLLESEETRELKMASPRAEG